MKYIECSTYNFNFEHYLTIISEYSETSLKGLLEKERQKREPIKLNKTKKLIIIYGIASGMKYLHSQNIIHRNLSSGRIFLDHNSYPKISSFDYIQNINEHQY